MVDVDPAVGLVRFDGLLIQLALVNLLDNALKYSDEGTAIEVAVEVSEFANRSRRLARSSTPLTAATAIAAAGECRHRARSTRS